MKESEFLELLNLYLDHEITAADAARLESEVATNPGRRKTYDAYCRMHKACGMVALDFSATDGTVVAGSDKVVPFDVGVAHAAARRRRIVGYLSGGLAAAACAALAFVGIRTFRASAGTDASLAASPAPVMRTGGVTLAQTGSAGAATSAQSQGRELGNAALASAQAGELRSAPKWVNAPLVLSGRNADAVLTAAQKQADDQLAWIQSVQFSPVQSRIQPEQIRFDAQPTSLQPEGRALGGRITPTTEPATEMAAFRFVK